MTTQMWLQRAALVAGAWGLMAGGSRMQAQGAAVAIAPASMAKIGTVSERFQSYNIEMVEVTGGRFWKPYGSTGPSDAAAAKAGDSNHPNGIDPGLFEYRAPINLGDPQLRRLAAALGPAYVRVSGTWQNTTYFQDDDKAAGAPPKGYNGVLTRAEWKGVIDFAKATDAEIVTSVPTSAGTRDAEGVWQPAEAKTFLAYTKAAGGKIAAAEYMNEPTMPSAAGAPADYDAAAFGRDVKVFVTLMRAESPQTVLLGPGGVGEGQSMLPGNMKVLTSDAMMAATGPVFDAFSYHFYGGVSARCAGVFPGAEGTTESAALSEEWLARTGKSEAFYARVRDHYEPGRPMWLTETAQTACGGDKWAATFADSFRYLNQLGALAQLGVQVVMHNTLAASDYALLDTKTLRPRPDYWAALLWRKTMGTTVLTPGVEVGGGLHVYAHCLRDSAGGVALLAINASHSATQTLDVPVSYERYTLSAATLDAGDVMLNGAALQLGSDGSLPKLRGARHAKGAVTLQPETITFVAMPKAEAAACR